MVDVSPDEVARSLGRPLTRAESGQVQQWVDDAQIVIRGRFPDLSLLDQDALAYVVREAVVLKVKRPDPEAKSTSVTIDDGSVAKTYERATGTITILDDWWALLTPRPARQSGAFTIRPGGACRSFSRSW